jgi:hypothetical protein
LTICPAATLLPLVNGTGKAIVMGEPSLPDDALDDPPLAVLELLPQPTAVSASAAVVATAPMTRFIALPL